MINGLPPAGSTVAIALVTLQLQVETLLLRQLGQEFGILINEVQGHSGHLVHRACQAERPTVHLLTLDREFHGLIPEEGKLDLLNGELGVKSRALLGEGASVRHLDTEIAHRLIQHGPDHEAMNLPGEQVAQIEKCTQRTIKEERKGIPIPMIVYLAAIPLSLHR